MAERKTRSRRTTSSRRSGAGRGRTDALRRLTDSIEASQAALKDLRSEMSRGSRDLLTDIDKTLRDSRQNLRRASRRIAKDVEDVRQAAKGKPASPARKQTSSRTTSGRRSTRARSSAKK
jgi:hypothetical protein